jgi:hypothetical protein
MAKLTRTEINTAVQRYSGEPREHIPTKYRDPKNERDFSIGLAILLASSPEWRDVSPMYDEQDNLIGWRGIAVKNKGSE